MATIEDEIVAVDAKVACDSLAKQNEREDISVLFKILAYLFYDESATVLRGADLAYLGLALFEEPRRVYAVRHSISYKWQQVKYSRRLLLISWKCLSEQINGNDGSQSFENPNKKV